MTDPTTPPEARPEAQLIADAVMAAVRAAPAVHIVNTDAVPTFKRRPDACIDRARVLINVRHALSWPLDFVAEDGTPLAHPTGPLDHVR